MPSFIRDALSSRWRQRSGQPAGWLQFLPFAIILGIFYFLILLPMKRRQKKIQEFQEALKVGDRVVTTSGIYGQITKLNDKSVQVQIADKVRIEIRAPGGRRISGPGSGRAGFGRQRVDHEQEPSLETPHHPRRSSSSSSRSASIRSSRSGISCRSRLAGGQAAQARARPQGRRAPRPARADRRGAAGSRRRRRPSRSAKS